MCKKIIAYNKNNEWIGSIDFVSYTEPIHFYPKVINSYKVYYPGMTHDFAVQLSYKGEEPTYREMYSYLRKIISQEIYSVIIE